MSEDYLEMKRKVDLLRSLRDKAQWTKDQMEKELLEKFGLKTIAEVEKEAKKLSLQADSLEAVRLSKMAEIQEKYKDLLEMAG